MSRILGVPDRSGVPDSSGIVWKVLCLKRCPQWIVGLDNARDILLIIPTVP